MGFLHLLSLAAGEAAKGKGKIQKKSGANPGQCVGRGDLFFGSFDRHVFHGTDQFFSYFLFVALGRGNRLLLNPRMSKGDRNFEKGQGRNEAVLTAPCVLRQRDILGPPAGEVPAYKFTHLVSKIIVRA